MKQNHRRILGLCIAALLLCVGCRTSDEEVQPADDLMRYIAERYPEDSFTWVCNELRSEGSSSGSFGISAKSAKFPDADIRVARWKDSEKMVYADNYMAFYLQDDVEAFMQQMAEEYFGECKVYEHISNGKIVSSNFPTDATVEDYLKSKPGCSIAIYLAPEGQTKADAQENLIKFQDMLTEKQYYNVSGGVRIISDQATYDGITSFVSYSGDLDSSIVDFVGGFEVK